MASSVAGAVTFLHEGSIGVAVIDNPPVNAINRAVRLGLSEALERATNDSDVEALLIVSAGKTFMAGADLTEFGGPTIGPTLQSLEAALENANLPVVVAIQGMALGGRFGTCHVLSLPSRCCIRQVRISGNHARPDPRRGRHAAAASLDRRPAVARHDIGGGADRRRGSRS